MCLPILSCSSWGLQCAVHHWPAGGLLHRHFTLAPCGVVYFLLRYPWGCPHSGFPSNSLLGARTFLRQEKLLPATDSFAVFGAVVKNLAAYLAPDQILVAACTFLGMPKIEQRFLRKLDMAIITG